MFGDKLRIIYPDHDYLYTWRIDDVIDREDRFYVPNRGWDLKKNYLHYCIATPEKEQLINEYIAKSKEFEQYRISVSTQIDVKHDAERMSYITVE